MAGLLATSAVDDKATGTGGCDGMRIGVGDADSGGGQADTVAPQWGTCTSKDETAAAVDA